ncbi:cyclin-dependent kinase F-3-like [Curcuma longa]|uniref:cyclin-dependent kinase F-3-like n=1 Tax=Curcuma longa TaxID=136217 RepID=UPI003D9E21F7
MEKYKFINEIGDGTCGNVYKSLNIENNEIVAIKKMKRKFYFWEECMNLCEAKSLRKLNHANIVKLKEIVRENHELWQLVPLGMLAWRSMNGSTILK